MENAAAEEIGIGGLRRLLLEDFHKLLAKPAGFAHFPQALLQ